MNKNKFLKLALIIIIINFGGIISACNNNVENEKAVDLDELTSGKYYKIFVGGATMDSTHIQFFKNNTHSYCSAGIYIDGNYTIDKDVITLYNLGGTLFAEFTISEDGKMLTDKYNEWKKIY